MNPGITVSLMLIGSVISGVMAANRNRSVAGWAIGGALVPLICIIVLAVSPAVPPPNHTLTGY